MKAQVGMPASCRPAGRVSVARVGTAGDVTQRRMTIALLALTAATVLADSAVVTLALPQILRELGGSVAGVSWVLIAFNLVLALLAVPAAWLLGRRAPGPGTALGIVVFAGASAACASASGMGMLIAARCVQAAGGALALVGCLELLVAVTDERRGVRVWTVSGVVGTAAGPVVGGLLTEAFSWQSIFIVQVPLTLLAVPAALAASRRGVHPTPNAGPWRPAFAPNAALALLSAALTAALFLLVLLLVEGWRTEPATAAVTVSVIPVAAFLAPWIARAAGAGPQSENIAGCLLVAGGLCGLALLAATNAVATLAPQALIGLGLGLTVDSLTGQALHQRLPRAQHGAGTITARHAGVVLGLALLTPILTADLRHAQTPAQEAITAAVLDAPLPGTTKIALAQQLADRLLAERGRVPDLHPAFLALHPPPGEQAAAAALEARLDEQLDRAALRAFRHAFLVAAGLAALALVPLLATRRSER
jgi:MFS family permease